jgi:hypothetical protein
MVRYVVHDPEQELVRLLQETSATEAKSVS